MKLLPKFSATKYCWSRRNHELDRRLSELLHSKDSIHTDGSTMSLGTNNLYMAYVFVIASSNNGPRSNLWKLSIRCCTCSGLLHVGSSKTEWSRLPWSLFAIWWPRSTNENGCSGKQNVLFICVLFVFGKCYFGDITGISQILLHNKNKGNEVIFFKFSTS